MGLLAAAFGCKPKVDTAGFEKILKEKYAALGLDVAGVTCLADVEVKVGNVIKCAMRIGTHSYDMTAKINSVTGGKFNTDTNWVKGEAIINGKLVPVISDELSKNLSQPVKVDCGSEPLSFIDAKRNVTCKATVDETVTDLAVAFDDKLNATNWKLLPALLVRAKIETAMVAAVADKVGAVKISCGDKAVLPRPADGNVVCKVTKDGSSDTKSLTVAVSENLDLGEWRIE
jgi:hypothetical protein